MCFELKRILMFIYFWERDRVRVEEGQRTRETQNPKQTPGSELSAQSPTRGLNPQTERSWPELKSVANRLSHPGTPMCFEFYQMYLLHLLRLACDFFVFIFVNVVKYSDFFLFVLQIINHSGIPRIYLVSLYCNIPFTYC